MGYHRMVVQRDRALPAGQERRKKNVPCIRKRVAIERPMFRPARGTGNQSRPRTRPGRRARRRRTAYSIGRTSRERSATKKQRIEIQQLIDRSRASFDLLSWQAGGPVWRCAPAGAAGYGLLRAHFLFRGGRIFPVGRALFSPHASKTPSPRSLSATASKEMEPGPRGTTRPANPALHITPFFYTASTFLRQPQRPPGGLALFFGPPASPLSSRSPAGSV